jgi:hypothetical protein
MTVAGIYWRFPIALINLHKYYEMGQFQRQEAYRYNEKKLNPNDIIS